MRHPKCKPPLSLSQAVSAISHPHDALLSLSFWYVDDEPDERLVQGDQRGVHGQGDDGQVEVVEHDGHVVVQTPARVEVEPQRAAADQGHAGDVGQPGAP